MTTRRPEDGRSRSIALRCKRSQATRSRSAGCRTWGASAAAETWASTVSAWASATPQKIDAFAAINEQLWGQIAAADPCAWKRNLHAAAAAWAAYRRT